MSAAVSIGETLLPRAALVASQPFFSDVSIEVSPKEAVTKAAVLTRLPLGTKVFVTSLDHTSTDEMVAAANALHTYGMVPVPHCSVRRYTSVEQFRLMLARLTGEAGVRQILLIAGSDTAPAGPFTSTLDVLRSGAIDTSGLEHMFVAGHPEGHPNADAALLLAALSEKQAFAQKSGIGMTIVTQFFFDAAPVIVWERRLRQNGITLPIRVGLHGITSMAKLARFGLMCGVGRSEERRVGKEC